ncbi:hypothetical protein NAI81_10720, partial [Francisella tularensis subsp. holarctica]|uniref:hypothetical protein n=1 Tax=Francisella tularensis TaxID=263 RepID=UPI002381B812
MNETINHIPFVNFLNKFIFFESFLNPIIIVFIFWISIICVCFRGLTAIFYVYCIAGFFEINLGAIFDTDFCEILIVLF